MDLGQRTAPDECQRSFKFRLRLAGEADDQVGRDGAAGEIAVQQLDALQIARGIIFPVHPAQDAVAAALEAQMELRAEVFKAGERLAEFLVDGARLK